MQLVIYTSSGCLSTLLQCTLYSSKMLTPLSGCGRFSLGTDDLHTGNLYWCLSLFWGGHATDSLYFGWNSVWWSSVPTEKCQQPLSSFTPPPTSLMLFPELDSLPPVSVKGSVLSLMEYGLIWKMCLQTCLQMDYISHMHWPGKTCSLRGHHYLEGVLYFKMEKGSWATTCIHCLCFLILDVIRVANSNSCCLQIHAMMNYFWNCESEKMFSPLSHFYWFVSLITSIGKEIKTICFWKKTKSGTLKSLCIFHYTLPEGRKKLTSQEALNCQGYTSDELPNWLLIRTNRKFFH